MFQAQIITPGHGPLNRTQPNAGPWLETRAAGAAGADGMESEGEE